MHSWSWGECWRLRFFMHVSFNSFKLKNLKKAVKWCMTIWHHGISSACANLIDVETGVEGLAIKSSFKTRPGRDGCPQTPAQRLSTSAHLPLPWLRDVDRDDEVEWAMNEESSSRFGHSCSRFWKASSRTVLVSLRCMCIRAAFATRPSVSNLLSLQAWWLKMCWTRRCFRFTFNLDYASRRFVACRLGFSSAPSGRDVRCIQHSRRVGLGTGIVSWVDGSPVPAFCGGSRTMDGRGVWRAAVGEPEHHWRPCLIPIVHEGGLLGTGRQAGAGDQRAAMAAQDHHRPCATVSRTTLQRAAGVCVHRWPSRSRRGARALSRRHHSGRISQRHGAHAGVCLACRQRMRKGRPPPGHGWAGTNGGHNKVVGRHRGVQCRIGARWRTPESIVAWRSSVLEPLWPPCSTLEHLSLFSGQAERPRYYPGAATTGSTPGCLGNRQRAGDQQPAGALASFGARRNHWPGEADEGLQVKDIPGGWLEVLAHGLMQWCGVCTPSGVVLALWRRCDHRGKRLQPASSGRAWKLAHGRSVASLSWGKQAPPRQERQDPAGLREENEQAYLRHCEELQHDAGAFMLGGRSAKDSPPAWEKCQNFGHPCHSSPTTSFPVMSHFNRAQMHFLLLFLTDVLVSETTGKLDWRSKPRCRQVFVSSFSRSGCISTWDKMQKINAAAHGSALAVFGWKPHNPHSSIFPEDWEVLSCSRSPATAVFWPCNRFWCRQITLLISHCNITGWKFVKLQFFLFVHAPVCVLLSTCMLVLNHISFALSRSLEMHVCTSFGRHFALVVMHLKSRIRDTRYGRWSLWKLLLCWHWHTLTQHSALFSLVGLELDGEVWVF